MSKKLVKHSPKALDYYRNQVMISVDLLAKKTNIPPTKIEKAHEEDEVFTFNQIEKLAKVLLISDFLLLTNKLKEFDIPKDIDYRNHIANDEQDKQYEMRKVIHEIVDNRENLIYTYDCLEIEPNKFDLRLTGDDYIKDAQLIREWLQLENIKYRVQSNDDYYHSWRLAIESKDVLVFEIARKKIYSEGISLYYATLPIIAILTTGQSPSRRLFTMIHELVHLGLRQSSVDGELLSTCQHQYEIEQYCNKVAGYVLLPQEVAEDIFNHNLTLKQNVINIRKQIKVSKEAIAIQLFFLDYISQNELNDYLSSLKVENKGFGGVKKVYLSANQFGKVYIQQVLSALWSDRISTKSAMNILNLKESNDLNTLEQKVFS